MTPRVPRFAIQVPMRYRLHGEEEWHEAKTENISHTGVLFRGARFLDVRTPVELRFQMVLLPPLEDAGVADVVCRGQIVRTAESPAQTAHPVLAATISEYEFLPGKAILAA